MSGIGEKVDFVFSQANNVCMFRKIFAFCWSVLFISSLSAQANTYRIRGVVTDNLTQQPLPGAHIQVEENESLFAVTGLDGDFEIEGLSPGRYNLKVSYLGYLNSSVLVEVTSGKEKVINISMEESTLSLDEVVVSASADKQRPVNSMSYASTRTFSVEETNKFAGAVDDPARMVQSYAGIAPTNDGSNYVSIRGNHPSGLLYRLEGIDIPNPNHFGDVASSGGGVAVISSQLLSNSDFSTGAFSAEYGNALSGIFDIKLRKGNNQKREWTIKAGFLGVEAACEGPISVKNKSSYLVNYRYSTLSLIDKLGVNLSGILNYSDLSYNLVFPMANNAQLSFFGINGWSNQNIDEDTSDVDFKPLSHQYQATFTSNVHANGVKYQQAIGKGFLTAIVSNGITKGGFQEDALTRWEDRIYFSKYNSENEINKWSTSWVYTQKMGKQWVVRGGIYADRLSFKFRYDKFSDEQQFYTLINDHNHTYMVRSFVQASFSFAPQWTVNAGMHATRFLLNNQTVVEPRLSLKYQVGDNTSMTVSYGKHSQIQPLMVYFLTPRDGSQNFYNKNLHMSRSDHYVFTLEHQFNKYTRLLIESYYQNLYDLPVGTDENDHFAIINQQFFFPDFALINKGKGRNSGIELTLERFLSKGLYFIVSASLSDAKYKTPTQSQWTNTRFNTRHSVLLTLGKEWKVGKSKRNIMGINVKNAWVGGQWDTPVDEKASQMEGKEVRKNDQAFSIKLRDFYKLDLGVKYRINKASRTATWSLDIMNATNHKNVGGVYYDVNYNETRSWTMMPMVPVLSYKLDF